MITFIVGIVFMVCVIYRIWKRRKMIWCSHCRKSIFFHIKEEILSNNKVLKYIECPRCDSIILEWEERR